MLCSLCVCMTDVDSERSTANNSSAFRARAHCWNRVNIDWYTVGRQHVAHCTRCLSFRVSLAGPRYVTNYLRPAIRLCDGYGLSVCVCVCVLFVSGQDNSKYRERIATKFSEWIPLVTRKDTSNFTYCALSKLKNHSCTKKT